MVKDDGANFKVNADDHGHHDPVPRIPQHPHRWGEYTQKSMGSLSLGVHSAGSCTHMPPGSSDVKPNRDRQKINRWSQGK
jgi:hypothetical protein